ncbi:MAG: MmcQ-like protein [Bacteroidetes bacterium]|nr:MAG: MmcQ-like protein [Bacteroidota bacterium]
MDIELLREYCLKKAFATEETPFGPDTLVMKVHGKLFCIFSISNFVSINLKCDPEKAPELRANYMAIEPGFHMNKKHWNTVKFDQDVLDSFVLEMLDDSYMLVVKTLPKKLQATIEF